MGLSLNVSGLLVDQLFRLIVEQKKASALAEIKYEAAISEIEILRKIVDSYLEERNEKFMQELKERAMLLEMIFQILESKELSEEEFIKLMDLVVKLSDWRQNKNML